VITKNALPAAHPTKDIGWQMPPWGQLCKTCCQGVVAEQSK